MAPRSLLASAAASLAAVATAAPALAADRVYWSNGSSSGSVSYANLDGSGGDDLDTTGATQTNAMGTGIHTASGRLYWMGSTGKVSFANLDGTGGGDLPTPGVMVSGPHGLAIDPVAGRVYWASSFSFDRISFARLDGSGGGDLDTGAATNKDPHGVALDPGAGRIYWANAGADGKISFANLDGSGGGGDVTTTGANVNNPQGVAVDPAVGRVYWTSVYGQTVSYANLDGSGGDDLDTTGATVDNPVGVAIDAAAGRIYWGNCLTPDISFANLDGSGGGGELETTGATPNCPSYPALLKAPEATGAPAISGGSTAGSVLTCSTGSWAPDVLPHHMYRTPQRYAYVWSLDGAEIAGATASTHTAAVTGDYRCTVTGSNEAGSATTQPSAPFTVTPAPPAPLAAPPPLGAGPVALASLTRYAISPTSFLAADRGPSAVNAGTRRRAARGAKVSFRVDQAASVGFRVAQRRPGRRNRRGRCVRPNRGNRTRRRCTRTVTLPGSFARAATAGDNSFRFTGRLRGRKLRPGRYRLVATPTANGRPGVARSTGFRIRRPLRRRAAGGP